MRQDTKAAHAVASPGMAAAAGQMRRLKLTSETPETLDARQTYFVVKRAVELPACTKHGSHTVGRHARLLRCAHLALSRVI